MVLLQSAPLITPNPRTFYSVVGEPTNFTITNNGQQIYFQNPDSVTLFNETFNINYPCIFNGSFLNYCYKNSTVVTNESTTQISLHLRNGSQIVFSQMITFVQVCSL
jgi:hypothetical protein